MKHYDCIVIGGGPAGMMAAIQAAAFGKRILLIDKNVRLGKKLLLSGNGRCNITNTCELDFFLERFSKNGDFLRDAFKHFFNKDLLTFFQGLGVEFKTEDNGRIFPASDYAQTIVKALEEALDKNNVMVRLSTEVRRIACEQKRVHSVILNNEEVFECDAAIVATGGLSYPSTGSTGDGLRIAKDLGHTIIDVRPGLVGLLIQKESIRSLQGLSLHDISLCFVNGKKKIKLEKADVLFTDSGISGPSVLNSSADIVDWLKEGGEVCMYIDLVPRLSYSEFDAWLIQTIQDNTKKITRNMLMVFLPERLIDLILIDTGIDPDKITSYITHEERKRLIDVCKSMRFVIQGFLPLSEAMISRGGISLKEINPRTMRSRLIENLYFAGELIDIDAQSGGFNMQAAFSTGYLAGLSVANS